MSRLLTSLVLLCSLMFLGCGGGEPAPTAPSTGVENAPITPLKVGKKTVSPRAAQGAE